MADTRTASTLGRVKLRLAAHATPRPTPAAHKYARAFMLRLARKLASSASQKRHQRRQLKRTAAVLCLPAVAPQAIHDEPFALELPEDPANGKPLDLEGFLERARERGHTPGQAWEQRHPTPSASQMEQAAAVLARALARLWSTPSDANRTMVSPAGDGSLQQAHEALRAGDARHALAMLAMAEEQAGEPVTAESFSEGWDAYWNEAGMHADALALEMPVARSGRAQVASAAREARALLLPALVAWAPPTEQEGCGACGDACASHGSECRLREESPMPEGVEILGSAMDEQFFTFEDLTRAEFSTDGFAIAKKARE